MSTDIVKFAFIAGELSPTLYGRGDLTKFDLGMAEAENFFVDFRGGLSSRPGFVFDDFVKRDDLETRMVDFAFSPDVEDTYVVLFGHEYVRFLQSGAYVLEDPIVIEGVTLGEPTVITITGHGLTEGRWVKITGVSDPHSINLRTFEVRNPTADTFELYSVPDGQAVSTVGDDPFVSGGSVRPIYEIESPYEADELNDLSFKQYRDYIRITGERFSPRDLIRTDHTDWTIQTTEISPYKEGPTITGSTESESGDAETIFAVTAVYEDGSESSIGNLFKVTNAVNYPVTEGSVSITWTPDPDAIEYKVYRSIVSVTEELSYGSELGYTGRTKGTKFTDPNIIPDFGQTPPQNYNPFAPGAITSVKVTAPGSGYTSTTAVTMSGGGTGFDGQVIVDDSGGIVCVVIKSGGRGYVNPTVSFGGGTATATATARPVNGTNPALSAIFQQRQIYSASFNNPITIWGSQYKRFDNFSASDFVLDSDGFEFDLDSDAISPIRHLFVTRGGLLAMTQKNVWMVNGGGANQPLSPTNALADPQTYTGVSALPPLGIDADIVYTEGKGYAVRMLSYNELSRVYAGDDKSVLSNHLFGAGRTIKRWGYQESPFKCVWCVREDGALLAFTVVKSEDVFAWTPGSTRGKFVDLLVVQEGQEDRVYVTTLRYINGRWTKFIEHMDLRQFVNVEDAWCVDAGLSLEGTYPAGTLTIRRDAESDTYVASVNVNLFSGAKDKILRVSNGIFRVSRVISQRAAELEVYSQPTNWMPQTDDTITFPVEEGGWTLDSPVTRLSGLWHLEGETVVCLGDGNVFRDLVVENGSVTLPVGVTRAIVGLGFRCRAKTLPMIVPEAGIEAKRKRIPGIAVRLTRSRGLKYGDDYDRLYEMRERRNEQLGRPTELQEGIRYQHIGTRWSENGQTCFQLDDPLPVTILSLVSDLEVGDESD